MWATIGGDDLPGRQWNEHRHGERGDLCGELFSWSGYTEITSMTAKLATPASIPCRRLPVFVLKPATELAAELHLPADSTNIFQRLIRNPHADSEVAKEREYAEMVCSVLQN